MKGMNIALVLCI